MQKSKAAEITNQKRPIKQVVRSIDGNPTEPCYQFGSSTRRHARVYPLEPICPFNGRPPPVLPPFTSDTRRLGKSRSAWAATLPTSQGHTNPVWGSWPISLRTWRSSKPIDPYEATQDCSYRRRPLQVCQCITSCRLHLRSNSTDPNIMSKFGEICNPYAGAVEKTASWSSPGVSQKSIPDPHRKRRTGCSSVSYRVCYRSCALAPCCIYLVLESFVHCVLYRVIPWKNCPRLLQGALCCQDKAGALPLAPVLVSAVTRALLSYRLSTS